MKHSAERLQQIAEVIETFYSDPISGKLWRFHPDYVNNYLDELVNAGLMRFNGYNYFLVRS